MLLATMDLFISILVVDKSLSHSPPLSLPPTPNPSLPAQPPTPPPATTTTATTTTTTATTTTTTVLAEQDPEIM